MHIGCKSEEKQGEEDTHTGAKFKAMVIEEDTFVACCLVCWLSCEG